MEYAKVYRVEAPNERSLIIPEIEGIKIHYFPEESKIKLEGVNQRRLVIASNFLRLNNKIEMVEMN